MENISLLNDLIDSLDNNPESNNPDIILPEDGFFQAEKSSLYRSNWDDFGKPTVDAYYVKGVAVGSYISIPAPLHREMFNCKIISFNDINSRVVVESLQGKKLSLKHFFYCMKMYKKPPKGITLLTDAQALKNWG